METQTATLLATTETIPLQMDADGVLRIGNTRGTLDTIVMAFLERATAEEIAQQYPSVSLADVYYTIGYYLRRQAEVETYLNRRRRQAEQVLLWKIIWPFALSEEKSHAGLFRGDSHYAFRPSNTAKSLLLLRRPEKAWRCG